MKLINIIGTSLFQIVSLIFLLGYLLGVLNMYFSDRNNYCEMTYMFEYPQFVPITVEENQKYPQYALYAYSEGRFTEKARKMWFDGIPVLFLPGNSGSHMQARSIASVALRKAIAKGYEYHFDFFTISFSEEYSGLYGGVLQRQTEFAAACVSKILSLYKNQKYTKSVPTSVIVIGHSMGGLVAKRLMGDQTTINTTNIVITLAAPLEAPVINFDDKMNEYYMRMDFEWDRYVREKKEINDKKLLISIGSGPRDVLVPAGFTSSEDSTVNALATAIPGVWVSPDHVSMVWCKQLVMVINRYLFDIVEPKTGQITENRLHLTSKAKQYFQANRSMTLNPKVKRDVVPMITDAFWYEDNRRIYQIARPSIDKTTYLMIRLVSFPQNRFVAIEAVNVDDKDWIFGCNAMYTHSTYRYCKDATSIGELSRWSGAAKDFGRRKLATINLHSLIEKHPEWSHVIVRVSPTRKPIVLNVDINDHASRSIRVEGISSFDLGQSVIVQETQPNALYYELTLPGFEAVHQAYLLYVEPTAECKATQYHVTAEMRVPWAENHEHFHYFTHLKRTPMKLRLWKSNPNVTLGLEPTQFVKVTLLLDPQCTFTISISSSLYHRLAQLARNYTPILVPYVAAIVLLAARYNFKRLKDKGTCVSIHSALMSDTVKPYYIVIFARLGTVAVSTIPFLMIFFENANWRNNELQYFTKSLLVLPAYMTALGILNVAAAAVLIIMVFSSQLASRLLFRIVWRGGSLSERVASGLQKVPMVVSSALVGAVPLSCGAASMAAGAAFYAFMLSKMYEEYLEDYVYKFIAKAASRICRIFKLKNKTAKAELEDNKSSKTSLNECNQQDNETTDETMALVMKNEINDNIDNNDKNREEPDDEIDEDLNNLNFHMMMFFLWMTVTIVNVPALLTWARNFKYSMKLQPDTSYFSGLTLAVCSTVIWQREGPRKNLRNYESTGTLLFAVAILIIVLGPFTLGVINYGVTLVFAIITTQQVFDEEIEDPMEVEQPTAIMDKKKNRCKLNEPNVSNDESNDQEQLQEDKEQANAETNDKEQSKTQSNNESNDKKQSKKQLNDDESNDKEQPTGSNECKDKPDENCDVCNESRMYSLFKNLRDKFSFSNDM